MNQLFDYSECLPRRARAYAEREKERERERERAKIRHVI